MLFIPQKGKILQQHNTGAAGALNIGTTVTTGSPSSTFGADVELIASTNFDAYWIEIMACDYALSATACEGMLTILIGSDPEEILIENLLMGHCGGPNVAAIPAGLGKKWAFPLYIPSGSRIAARAAGARTNTDLRVAVHIFGGHGMPPFRVGNHVQSWPSSPSVPRGQSITPGASGAEGNWTEIAASASSGFCVVPSFQVATDTTVTQRTYAFDIGIGASTQEQEIMQSYWYVTGTGEEMTGHWPLMPCFADIASGSRLVARVSNSGTNDTAYDAMLHVVS